MASTMDAVVRKDDVRKYFWFCGNCFVDGLQGICGWAARCSSSKKTSVERTMLWVSSDPRNSGWRVAVSRERGSDRANAPFIYT